MKKLVNIRYLIYFQVIYNCIIKFLITDFHFPSILNYVTDIVNLLIFLGILLNKKKFSENKKNSYSIIIIYILLILIDLIMKIYIRILFQCVYLAEKKVLNLQKDNLRAILKAIYQQISGKD